MKIQTFPPELQCSFSRVNEAIINVMMMMMMVMVMMVVIMMMMVMMVMVGLLMIKVGGSTIMGGSLTRTQLR